MFIQHSLQSQSWFYTAPNQDSTILATCLYQLTHTQISYLITITLNKNSELLKKFTRGRVLGGIEVVTII